tara:strand:- start:185 stop:1138 length:954 start_codon:yes stop_codon:yes gene_type:complete
MELYTPKSIDDILIPNKQEWCDFIQTRKKERNYNIACIGPHDTCKTTMLNIFLNEFVQEHEGIQRDKLIYKLSLFDDIHLNNLNNNLSIFCQNHTNHDKIVYIEYYEQFNEQNQQLLKSYIDKYNLFKEKHKVHFIIEATQENKIKDIIKTRMNVFYTNCLTEKELFPIFKKVCETECIIVNPNTFDFFTEKKNITISSLTLFVQKLILLHIQNVDYSIFKSFYDYIDCSIFESYLYHIKNNDYHDANKLLFELYEKGYDLGDIFFYLYEYMKENNTYTHCIDVLCYYINQHYNGRYSSLFIIFLTNDLRKKIKYIH